VAEKMSNVDVNKAALESEQSLSEIERKILSFIKQCAISHDPPICARVAGGWVRDKLLELESVDLDIALENISGVEFGTFMKTVMNVRMASNPEQSQHLASAKVLLFDSTWIDMCQLRCDEYGQESRIPKIRVGTPLEDCMRRDFTINALFYNINTGKVEDLVNGLEDLKSGILRTPIDPFVSFRDDPLRISRGFRFAATLDFTVGPDIISAAKSAIPEFRQKVSHARLEPELSRTLNNKRAIIAIRLYIDSGLFDLVFDSLDLWHLDHNQVIQRVTVVCSHTVQSYAAVLAGIYAPLFDMPSVVDPLNNKKKISALECAIMRGIHAPLSVFQTAQRILRSASLVSEIFDIGVLTRSQVGRWIREVGDVWRMSPCVLFKEEAVRFFNDHLLPFVENEELDFAWDIKPLLNGKELAAVHKVKIGPGVAKLQALLMDWQFEHPNGTVDDYLMSVRV
jgi:tRNA nucleotidyltransferase (CCA-adding enzyme)